MCWLARQGLPIVRRMADEQMRDLLKLIGRDPRFQVRTVCHGTPYRVYGWPVLGGSCSRGRCGRGAEHSPLHRSHITEHWPSTCRVGDGGGGGVGGSQEGQPIVQPSYYERSCQVFTQHAYSVIACTLRVLSVQ